MSTDDTPAVDRESLFSAMTTMCKVLGMDQVTAESTAVEHIGMWFNEGILRDVREVQHEHDNRQPDTPAVDREALVKWAHDEEGLCHPWEDYARCDCSERVDRLLAAAGLRDAAAVRHEHGERIADAVMPKLVDVYGTNGFPVRLLRQALGYTVSPAPDLGTPWTPPDGAFTDPGFTHDDLWTYGDLGHKIFLTLVDGGADLGEVGMDEEAAAVKTRRIMELLADEGRVPAPLSWKGY